MTTTANWFEVDRHGLAKLLDRAGRARVVMELVSNALDTDAKRIDVTLEPVPNLPYANLTVEDDDPNGFADLGHAFTLFAESTRKGDAEKRGRFNLGEKLALAICKSATIQTTTGAVVFNDDGRQVLRGRKHARDRGSSFSATVMLDRARMAEAIDLLRQVIPPEGVNLVVNGMSVTAPDRVLSFPVERLDTEVADEEGALKRTQRNTNIVLYRQRHGETTMLYEMGIPVVELDGDDKWHIDVQQKIPLNMDRDNAQPAFLRKVRAAVLNAAHHLLRPEDASATWIAEATTAPEIEGAAYKHAMELQHTNKSVMFDPSDQEANKIAVAQGYRLIYGSQLTDGQRSNRKRFPDVLRPSGQVTPSPKPYSTDPTAEPAEFMPNSEASSAMRWCADHAYMIANELLGKELTVRWNVSSTNFIAAFHKRDTTLDFAVKKLGRAWFDRAASPDGLYKLHALLIHELAHNFVDDHLSSDFHEACCDLGARLARLALRHPNAFEVAL